MKNKIILLALLLGGALSNFAQEESSLGFIKLDHRASIGVGIRNFKVDYNISTVIKDRVIVGAGLGFYTNKVKLYSYSDEHEFTVGSIPLYAVVQVNVFENAAANNFYLKLGYGNNYNINYQNTETELAVKHTMFFGGAGYQFELGRWYRKAFVEVSQFVSTAKGVATSTYDSKISYNLDVYAVHLTFGIKINKY